MKIENVHPELRKVIRYIPPMPFHNRLFAKCLNILNWGRRKNRGLTGVEVSRLELSKNSVRIYRPEREFSGAGLLWIHGGGLISGRADRDDQFCATYVRNFNLVVVSIDYRLAPEYPFPEPLNDCYDSWKWFLTEAANLGVNPERIVISGRSAGGGLAASLVHKIVDAGGTQPVGQALFCPMLDDRTAADFDLDSLNHWIWNNKSNRAGWTAYLGKQPGLSEVPQYAVPARRINMSGLPPTWIGVGDIDLFFEENRRYCEQLQKSGVDCELHVSPMAPHGFENLVPKASIVQNLYKSNHEFLRTSLNL